MEKSTKNNLEGLFKDLKAIRGTRLYDVNKESGDFKIGLSIPDGKDISVIVETSQAHNCYLDLKRMPEITPTSLLKVAEVLMNHDYVAPFNLHPNYYGQKSKHGR